MDTNLFVFDGNYKELKTSIGNYSQQDNVPLIFDRDKGHLILHQIIRLHHNYLASAKNLIDHTRTLINDWYKKEDFLIEYNNQVKKQFSKNEFTGFIEDLRNYALHYSLLISGVRLSVHRNPETDEQAERVVFFIEKNTLLEWSKWSKGRTFLNKSEDEINIEKLADEYYGIIINFHGWLNSRLKDIHKEDLSWLLDMQMKIDILMKTIREMRKGDI